MLLFDESALRKLERLTLVAERVRAGRMKGERRSTSRGSSIEFADFRSYVQGDDLRRLDWNSYARLGRPFIRLLEDEEDLAVHLLVDGSASMDWPAGEKGPENKLRYALLLAGALGHIGLVAGDQLSLTILNSSGNRRWGPHRGRRSSLHLLQFLEAATPGGITRLNDSLRDYGLRASRPGLLFVISDLLSPDGYQDGLSALQARGFEVGIIHLLSDDEVEPPLGGDLKLVDVETGAAAEISLDSVTLALYHKRLHSWQVEIAADCNRRRIHYIPVITTFPWDKLVLQTLRLKGVVK